MKAISIDFVPDRRWLRCWMIGVLGLAVLASAVSRPLWRLHGQRAEANIAVNDAKVRLSEARRPARAVTDTRYDSAARAASLLQAELNPLLATVEGLEQSSAKLFSLSLDLGTASARVEYIADSTASAAELSGRLNGGYDSAPWRLESINSVGGGGNAQQGIRAVWIVRLSELR